MDNLTKINKAWSCGWSATIEGRQVVSIAKDFSKILVVKGDDVALIMTNHLERPEYKITGYIYAGELAGSEIPEGQKFRQIKSGRIGTAISSDDFSVLIQFEDGDWTEMKNELEPYFD